MNEELKNLVSKKFDENPFDFAKIVDFCEKYEPTFSEIMPGVYACATENQTRLVLGVRCEEETVYKIGGLLPVNRQKFTVSAETVDCIDCLSLIFDVVVVPLVLLNALKYEGIRDRFLNVVSFANNNWSY